MEIVFILAISVFLWRNRDNISSLPSLKIFLLVRNFFHHGDTVDENENNESKTEQKQAQNEPAQNELYFYDVDPDRYTAGRVGDRKWCLGCGVYLGSLDELGSAKFNRIKRCPPCADAHNRYKRRLARQKRKNQSINGNIQIANSSPPAGSGAGAAPQIGTQNGQFVTVRSK